MTGAATSDVVIASLWMYGLAIIISMASAVVIWMIVHGISALQRPAAKPAASGAGSAAVAQDTGPPAAHVAAITAAISAAVGSHRIVRISEVGRSGAWSAEGKLIHQTSHAPQRRPGKY
ncbi:MAG: hypothetical protein KDE22_08140 [Rhodobacterales bacterium]|nr:hypothetical protein [Rhodobacterales bacterium]